MQIQRIERPKVLIEYSIRASISMIRILGNQSNETDSAAVENKI